jgi:hypothetical protein
LLLHRARLLMHRGSTLLLDWLVLLLMLLDWLGGVASGHGGADTRCPILTLLVSVLSQQLRKLAIVDHRCGRDIRVSLEHFKGLLERLDDLAESASALCDVLRLTQLVQNRLVFVNLLIKLGLELLLRHTHEEVTDELRDCLTDGADGDLENGVDTHADLLHEDVGAAGHAAVLLLLLLRLLLDRLAILIELLGHLVLLGHDRRAVLLVITVVNEHVVLLGVDDSFDELASVIALTLQDLADDVHDLGAQRGAAHENPLNNRRS